MAQQYPVNGTAYTFYVGLESQGVPGTFQANPTLAAGDVKVSKDGGALANITTLPTVTPASGKAVQVALSATEMTCDNLVIIFSDAAGAEWNDLMVTIQPQTVANDAAYNRLGTPAGASVSADVAAVKAQTAAIETDTQDIQGRLPAALVSGRIDANVGAISDDSVAADNLEAACDGNTYNVGGGAVVAASVTGNVGGNVVGSVNGNVDGSVASVAGGVGGSVASVTGTVGGIAGTINTLDALATAQDAQHAATQALVTTVDGVADAIRAKTDNLPASPAAVGSAMTLATDAVSADALAADAVTEIAAGITAGTTYEVDGDAIYVNGKLKVCASLLTNGQVDTSSSNARASLYRLDGTLESALTTVADPDDQGEFKFPDLTWELAESTMYYVRITIEDAVTGGTDRSKNLKVKRI